MSKYIYIISGFKADSKPFDWDSRKAFSKREAAEKMAILKAKHPDYTTFECERQLLFLYKRNEGYAWDSVNL